MYQVKTKAGLHYKYFKGICDNYDNLDECEDEFRTKEVKQQCCFVIKMTAVSSLKRFNGHHSNESNGKNCLIELNELHELLK